MSHQLASLSPWLRASTSHTPISHLAVLILFSWFGVSGVWTLRDLGHTRRIWFLAGMDSRCQGRIEN